MTSDNKEIPNGEAFLSGSSERIANVLKGLAMLPPMPGLSFRGWVPPTSLPPHTLVTKLITATSLNPVVASMDWSSKQIAVIVGHSGRDVSFVSEVPDAQEITYLPGTIFHMHASMVIDGMQARIFEECMPSENGLDAMNIDPDDVFRSVRDIIRKRRHEPLRVPLEYCKRFVGRLE